MTDNVHKVLVAGVRAAMAAGTTDEAKEIALKWIEEHGVELLNNLPEDRELEALEALHHISSRFFAATAVTPFIAELGAGDREDMALLRTALERSVYILGKDAVRRAIQSHPQYRKVRSLAKDILTVNHLYYATDEAYHFPNRTPSRDVTAIRDLLKLWLRMGGPTKPLTLKSPLVTYIGRVLELLGSPLAAEKIVRAIKDALRGKEPAKRRRAKADSETERAAALTEERRSKEAREE